MGEAPEAIAALDGALDLAAKIRDNRNKVLEDTTATWYENWFPRVGEGNGRRFVDRVDDVKDHLPVRTADMTYLIYRELLFPMDEWAGQTLAVRNSYAVAHHLPARSFSLNWKQAASEGGHA